ncbi:MAG: PilZ domain-containing protein [Gallionella sp.]
MMSENSAAANDSSVSLKALRLRSGTPLKLRSMAKGFPEVELQLLGIIEGKGVMVTPHKSNAANSPIKPGESCTVSGFSGQYAFSFSAQIVQAFEAPIAYFLLSYPASVEARLVRHSIRSKTSLPATASPHGKNASVAVTMMDLSIGGTMLNSPITLGVRGDEVDLAFTVKFEANNLNLAICGTVCHSGPAETGQGYRVGLLFKDLTQNDKLVLHYIVQSTADSN